MIESINSQLFEATNRMSPKNGPHKIQVFTESFEDIAFWRAILDDFTTSRYQFEITTSSRNTNVRGKHEVLNRELDILSTGVGIYMIICIDSDYDYLLQYSNPVSTTINKSPYIFQTYVYSIENYMCFAESLHSVCTLVSANDTLDTDFENILTEYSNIIYKLLLLSIWLAKQGDSQIFTLSNLASCIAFSGKLILQNKNKWFGALRNKVRNIRYNSENIFCCIPTRLAIRAKAIRTRIKYIKIYSYERLSIFKRTYIKKYFP